MKCFVSNTESDDSGRNEFKERKITMSNKASEVTAYDAVPCGAFPAVELRER
jgi:hypothetical protein